MIDIHVCYEQKEALDISNHLKEHGLEHKVEETSSSLQAYAPATVTYIIKVNKDDVNQANDLLDELFE